MLAVLLAACAPGASAPAATSSLPSASGAAGDRVAAWRSDLGSLLPAMERLHPALYHGATKAELEAAVAALVARAPGATDDQMLVGLLRIVAMVSSRGCDSHTGAFIWGDGTKLPVDGLPLRLWWFEEGMVVVDALPPHKGLVGWRLESVNGRPMSEVLAAVDPLVPRDNVATVRLLMPRFLLIPQVLRGLGLAGSGPISVTLGRGTERRDVSLAPIPMREYNAWAGPYGLHLPADPEVLYLSRTSEPLWWRALDDSLLYIQYNRVDRPPSASLDALRTAIAASGAGKIVVDVRHNFGGEVSAIDPMAALFKDPAVDRPGRLFVITGRNTYSAATMFVARLDATTGLTVVGEQSGGCPTFYGNARPAVLPRTGVSVSVATELEIGVSADDRRAVIEPELPARLTPQAWAEREDPALAAIRAIRR